MSDSEYFPAAEPREPEFTLTAESGTCGVFVLAGLGLFFGGIGGGVGFAAWNEGETGGALVGGVFFLVGLVCIGGAIKTFLAGMRLEPPSITISQNPLYLGESFSAEIVQRVKQTATIQSVKVTLVCREWVQYTQGTDTRAETHDIFTVHESLDVRGVIEPPDSIRGHIEFQIPEEGMHTFTASDNRVLWKIEMHTDVAGWPDFKAEFELSVAPRLIKETELTE